MKIGYFIKDHCQSIEDAIYFDDLKNIDECLYESYIEDACNYAWSHNDGWEWIRDDIVFTLVIDDKEIEDYKIIVEYDPVFTAYKKK